MTETAPKRILLKLSGEAAMGDQSFGIDPATVARVASEVKQAKDEGIYARSSDHYPVYATFVRK